MQRLPVMQMKLEMTSDFGIGWCFSDEENEEPENDVHSFSYTVPWIPSARPDATELVLYGEQAGAFTGFTLRYNGRLFVNDELGIRFTLDDPMAPEDFRGLPFLRAFPYIGKSSDLMHKYGVHDRFLLVPLGPLDLIRMDDLFLTHRIVFVGVTKSFGPHRAGSADWRFEGEPFGGESGSTHRQVGLDPPAR